MTFNNVSIMGLAETNINNREAKFIYKNNPKYTAYFDNSSNQIRGLGVGIIVSNEYAKFIHKVQSYQGRLIYIDMFMKGHIKLRIIQVYLHANFMGTHDAVKDIHNKLNCRFG